MHQCLKQAGGQFKFVKDNLIFKLLKTSTENTESKLESYADINDLVLVAYITQSKAEAFEVTIQRAIDQKHSPSKQFKHLFYLKQIYKLK